MGVRIQNIIVMTHSGAPFKLVDEERGEAHKHHRQQHEQRRPAVDGARIHKRRWENPEKNPINSRVPTRTFSVPRLFFLATPLH